MSTATADDDADDDDLGCGPINVSNNISNTSGLFPQSHRTPRASGSSSSSPATISAPFSRG